MFVLPLLRENKTPGCPIQRVLENDFVVVTGTVTARDFIRLLTVDLRFLAVAGDFMTMLDIAKVLKSRMGVGKKGTDAGTAKLDGAPRRDARSGDKTDSA